MMKKNEIFSHFIKMAGIFVISVGCWLSSVTAMTNNTTGQVAVDFNFDKVDIPTFVRLVGEITGKRFVVSDKIKGKVTVVSPKVTPEKVYPLFVSILESAGCSVVKDGELYQVVPLPDREMVSTPIICSDDLMPTNGVITRIIHLDNIPAASMKKALESRLGGNKAGNISIIEESNHLIITDTVSSIKQLEKIIKEIDKPGAARNTEVVVLKYATAVDLARQINDALAESENRVDRLKNRLSSGATRSMAQQAYVVASPDSNKLILVGSESQIKFMKNIIAQMDVDVPAGSGRLSAIFLKYIKAKDAAENINSLLNKSNSKSSADKKRNITIEANEANNALLINASPGDFRVVSNLVSQLDKPREQVHIEVMIAEVSADNSLNFGVEMAVLNKPNAVGDTVVQGANLIQGGGLLNAVQKGVFPNGITIGAAHGSHLDASGNVVVDYPGLININATKQNGKMKILSETALEAQNNSEASVRIVDDIPILKSTISGGAGTSRDIIQNIERIEVGIKLMLTPHVIPGNLVRMELNPQIEAIVESKNTGTPEERLTPTIARREVKTTVTVPDNRTIIIAGLTRQDKADVVRKVPFLGSIPLLGYLFKQKATVDKKTNLLIFVTPRVVSNIANAEKIREEWKDKTGLSGHESEKQKK